MEEAKVSWNTVFLSPKGYECQLTLRGDTEEEVLARAKKVLAGMGKAGCQPVIKWRPFKAENKTGEDAEKHYCTIHKTPFRKYTKNGRSWYSHRAPDGSWCREEAKKAENESETIEDNDLEDQPY